MIQKGMRIIQAAVVLLVVAAVLFFVQQLMQRDRGDGSVTIDPAVEKKLTARERMVLTTRIGSMFPEWVELWRSSDARFDPSALQRDSIETIDPVLITGEDDVHVPLDDASLRALVSPDGTRYLEYTGGAGEGEPDSELTLVDAVTSERQRLLFYGPSVRFDDAAWVDDDTVVVVGDSTEDGEPHAGKEQPLVWIFHLSNRIVSTYSASAR